MRLLKLMGLSLVFAVGMAAAQDPEKTVEMKIVVDGEDADGSTFSWVSSDSDLDLHNMAVGESRVIEGDDGQPVTVTRVDHGLEFDVAGEKVLVPNFEQGGMVAALELDALHDGTVAVQHGEIDVVSDVHVVTGAAPTGVTIISDEALDDSVKESIRSVLISAGRDDEVTFIDSETENQRVRIVKKKVQRL